MWAPARQRLGTGKLVPEWTMRQMHSHACSTHALTLLNVDPGRDVKGLWPELYPVVNMEGLGALVQDGSI